MLLVSLVAYSEFDRLICIRYFPVRSKSGEYLGCIEVTQEIMDIRVLKEEGGYCESNIAQQVKLRRKNVEKMWNSREQRGVENSVAQAVGLVDLVGYQEGSVVSRTIVDKKTGTVTLFAFDEGQGLSEHTVPFDALVHILDGEAQIVISGKPFHLKKGEMIIMPANEPHALEAAKRFKMILTMIRS